jgi:hypothetical protein
MIPDWNYTHTETDPAKIAEFHAAELAGCIKLTAAVSMAMINLNGWKNSDGIQPVAYIDTAKRGDLQRLVAKLEKNGDGDVVAAWRFLIGAGAPSQVAVLDCQWTAPFVAGFRVAFDMLKHRDFLETVLERGHILFSFGGKPSRGVMNTVAVPITQMELVAILMITEPLYRSKVRSN